MKFAIYKHQIINANRARRHLKYTCPFCHRRATFHESTLKRQAYFAHSISVKAHDNPGETSEHLLGKQQLFQFFKTPWNKVRIEVYLPRINQWPDLMVNQTVIEFQCSPISSKKLASRISGYTKLGLKSWWLLGSPYQKRRLGAAYLARFMNYTYQLGFFILFWEVKRRCLKINYEIREVGGRLSYQTRRFMTIRSLKRFIRSVRLNSRKLTVSGTISVIKSEIMINQRRLFHGDRQLMKLQDLIGVKHNTLMGCPIICHYPVITLPIFRNKALLWRIWILWLTMNGRYSFKALYLKVNRELGLPLTFCQFSDADGLYRMEFHRYIKLLINHHYLKVGMNNKITGLKKPRWFNSYYDKLTFLRSRLFNQPK